MLVLVCLHVIMEMRLESLKRVIQLELHDHGKIGDQDKTIIEVIGQKQRFWGNMFDIHEIYSPHFPQQTVTNADIRPFMSDVK